MAVVGPGGDSRHRKMLVAVAAQVLDGFYGAVPAIVDGEGHGEDLNAIAGGDDGQGVRLPYSVVTSEIRRMAKPRRLNDVAPTEPMTLADWIVPLGIVGRN